MPLELRKILFSVPELKSAIVHHCRKIGKTLPDTSIARLVISEEPRALVTLHFRPSYNPADPAAVPLHGNEVMAALIGYCVDHNIPLPRAAKKVLWPQDDGMSLMITLHSTEQRLASGDSSAAPQPTAKT